MGFLNGKIISTNEFSPGTLYEDSIDALFLRCSATSAEKEQHTEQSPTIVHSGLFMLPIHKIHSDVVLFSKKKLDEEEKYFRYLFGQLAICHILEKRKRFEFKDAVFRYDGVVWTNDPKELIKLFTIGCAYGTQSIFSEPQNGKNYYSDIAKFILPTISPKDPNFPAWWEQHKLDWEK